jgi:predicted HAD superfamily Cof-like phosphohydrolase
MNTYLDVKEFNEKIIGIKIPKKLKRLDKKTIEWYETVFKEETQELIEAWEKKDFNGQLDAIIDLVYFALGFSVKMGVKPEQFYQAWKNVQLSNMNKKKGNKGRGSDVDAIKPKGWKDPKGVL